VEPGQKHAKSMPKSAMANFMQRSGADGWIIARTLVHVASSA
jgi:hypothetical protein